MNTIVHTSLVVVDVVGTLLHDDVHSEGLSDLIKRECVAFVIGPHFSDELLDLGERIVEGDTVNEGVIGNKVDHFLGGLGVLVVARDPQRLSIGDELVPWGGHSCLIGFVGNNPLLVPSIGFCLLACSPFHDFLVIDISERDLGELRHVGESDSAGLFVDLE